MEIPIYHRCTVVRVKGSPALDVELGKVYLRVIWPDGGVSIYLLFDSVLTAESRLLMVVA